MRNCLHLVQNYYGVSQLVELAELFVSIGKKGVEELPEGSHY